MTTDIELVRHSLNSFFKSMIDTYDQRGESREARLIEIVHRHAMELPGIGEPGWLERDDPESDDFLKRHKWLPDRTCAVKGCMALEGDPGWAWHEDPK